MRAGRWAGGAIVAMALAAPPAGAAAQTPAEPITLVFPARPDVCGTGDGIVIREAGGTTRYVSAGRRSVEVDRGWSEADPPCETGRVVVAMGTAGGDAAVTVIPRERAEAMYHPETGAAVWLSGQEAADRLLEAARGAEPDRRARMLVLGAMLARDAVVWPALLEMARDRSLGGVPRKAALHWLGRRAGARAAAALGGIVRDATEADEIRDAAVFGLSQLRADRAVPALIEVVRVVDDPRVRSRSLFWLSEFDDPRVLTLFEEILTAPGRSPGSGSSSG